MLYTFTPTWAIAGSEKSNLTLGLKGFGYGADIENLSGISLFRSPHSSSVSTQTPS